MSTDAAREDQFFEEHRDDLGRSLDDMPAEYWGQVVPVAPEVQAILDAWRAGDTSLPWSDAQPEPKISSDEEGPPSDRTEQDGTAA